MQAPEWDNKFGPATLASLGSLVVMLITIGVMWGTTTAKIDAAAEKALEAKKEVEVSTRKAEARDKIINDHSVSLATITTQLGYITPAIQRIETKLGAKP